MREDNVVNCADAPRAHEKKKMFFVSLCAFFGRGSCKTFFDGRVERVERVDLAAEMFQLAHCAA